MTFQVQIIDNGSLIFSLEFARALELGRQQQGEPKPVAKVESDGVTRLIVTALDDLSIGRRQLFVESAAGGTLRLTNLSDKVSLRIRGGRDLDASDTRTVSLPATIFLSGDRIATFRKGPLEPDLESLASATLAPGQGSEFAERFIARPTPEPSEEAEHLVQVLQATMDVFQGACTAEELHHSAVTSAVKLVKFDRARILKYDTGTWTEQMGFPDDGAMPSRASHHVLNMVLANSRTFWDTGISGSTESLANVDAVIAAPILNSRLDVIAALYGERLHRPGINAILPITRVDARLMELLACGVASGLARQRQEETTRRLQTRFEQFFTPELARELEAHPDLLVGRDADVSILFCDIRGFSRISELIGTQTTFEFINDVMGAISECVVKNRGVLVDYVGDAVMAMWGAPQPQDDHAELACGAAIEMLERLPELNRRWDSRIDRPIDLAIGINSGRARVGNSGTEYKFKYGPLGNTVNLASRVQGATKHLKTQLLISHSTAEALSDDFSKKNSKRKLCQVRVVNIQEPVGLFELTPCRGSSLYDRYEQALTKFEAGEFKIAASELGQLLDAFPDDGPTLVLLSRVVNAIFSHPEPEHPLWRLDGK